MSQYLVKVNSAIMNSFENYLVSIDIDYRMLSSELAQGKVNITYALDTDEDSLSFIKLAFDHHSLDFLFV